MGVGRKPKPTDKPKISPPSSETQSHITDILRASDPARIKAYQNYLFKIKSGHTISKSEFEAFKALEVELEGINRPQPSRLKGQKEVCEYLGISKQRLSWHVKRGSISQNPDGTWNVEELDKWRGKYLKKDFTEGGKTTREKKELADLTWKQYRAERERILLDQIKSNLYPKTLVDSMLYELIFVTKRKLQLIPDMAVALFANRKPEEQKGILAGVIDEVCSSLAQNATIEELEKRIKQSL